MKLSKEQLKKIIIEVTEKVISENEKPVNEMVDMMDPVTLSLGAASLFALWRMLSSKGDSNDIALQNARAAIEKKMAEAGMTPPGVPPQDVKQPIGGGRQSGSGKAALHKNIRTGGMGEQR